MLSTTKFKSNSIRMQILAAQRKQKLGEPLLVNETNGAIRATGGAKAAQTKVTRIGRAETSLVRIASKSGRLLNSVSSAIDEQYDLFDTLSRQLETMPTDSNMQNAISACLEKLHHLQTIEAQRIEKRIMQSLRAPIGQGQALLEDANALIEKYGNLACSDIAAE